MFDTWNRASETGDASLLHSILSQEIAGRCTVEQLQVAIDQEGLSAPALEVESVFLDLENFDRAMVEMSVRTDSQSASDGLATAFSVFPFPIDKEEGRWRISFRSFLPVGEDCPFADEDREDATPTPAPAPRGLQAPEFPGLEDQDGFSGLEPPPGTDSLGSSVGAGDGQLDASILLETDMTPAELLQHYRDLLAQPSWEIRDEHVADDAAWLTWTVRDGTGNLWLGLLMTGTAEEGKQRVRLSLATAAEVDIGFFRPPPRPPEPAVPPPPDTQR